MLTKRAEFAPAQASSLDNDTLNFIQCLVVLNSNCGRHRPKEDIHKIQIIVGDSSHDPYVVAVYRPRRLEYDIKNIGVKVMFYSDRRRRGQKDNIQLRRNTTQKLPSTFVFAVRGYIELAPTVKADMVFLILLRRGERGTCLPYFEIFSWPPPMFEDLWRSREATRGQRLSADSATALHYSMSARTSNKSDFIVEPSYCRFPDLCSVITFLS
ncbi:unnamed protein product [Spodoptera exigua]|nr:unnamed protein product [Spodoptera exigua]